MIQEVTQYIANLTDFKIGVDLFAGFRPVNAPRTHVVVLESVPSVPSPYLLDYVDYYVQVLASGSSYWEARKNARTIFTALHGKVQVNLPVITVGDEYLVNFIEAEHVPQSLGQTKGGAWEFSNNFIFKLQNA